jgi:hypothetical protein
MLETDVDSGASRFLRWLSRPEMLVGLSAVLLSVCGLFISIYEASLMRTEQRAAVWPHVETAVSINDDDIAFWVQNTGIGPARIRAAALTHDGQTLAGWDALMEVLEIPTDSLERYYSVINGRVLAVDARREVIFRVSRPSGPAAPEALGALARNIIDGTLDVAVCYCSVYEECHISRLQDLVQRARGTSPPESREMKSCEAAERSGI